MNKLYSSVFPKYLLQRWIIVALIAVLVILTSLKLTERWPRIRFAQRPMMTSLTPYVTTAVSGQAPLTKLSEVVTVGERFLNSNATKGPVLPQMKPGQVVPKIVHFCWYGGKRKATFRFHHFIGILAVHKHIKPDRIMFWHEVKPIGDLWNEINSKVPNIEMVFQKAPTTIQGKSVKVPEHQSDVVRLEVVMKYGGIYLDLDVIALKSFDPLLQYDVTMGLQSDNGLCNGAIIAKPGAEFLTIWHEEYKTFSDKNWAYHSVYLPFKLYESHKDLVHVEERTIHRPSWFENEWIYEEGKLYDWSKNYAMHLWYRKYNKDLTPTSIRKLNSTLGQIFRFIYYGSADLL